MNVPALRFPEFEGTWKDKRLGQFFKEHKEKSASQDQHEVFTSARSGLMRQKEYYANDRITERDNIGFNVVPEHYLTYRSRSDDRRFYFNENCLGIVGIISVYYPVFKIIDGDNQFFKALLSKYIDYIGRYSVGTSQTVLSFNELKKVKLPLTNSAEQKKIAAFLGVVDQKLTALAQVRAGLQTYKRGLMQKLFGQDLRFTQPDGSTFPDWEEKRLGDVFTERSERGDETAELLSVTMSRGVLRAVDVTRAHSASADRSNYKIVYIGDIAYNSMRMWQGANGVSQYAGIVSPAYTVIVPAEDQVHSFWGYCFKLTSSIQEFQRRSQGLTSDTWNLKFPALAQIKMKVPHPDEQRLIADALQTMDVKISAVSDQITQMEAFKKGLLQQMFV